jgi:hypothetical protein
MASFAQAGALILLLLPSAGNAQDFGVGLRNDGVGLVPLSFGPDLGATPRTSEQIAMDEFVIAIGFDRARSPKMGEPGPLGRAITDLLSEREKHVQWTQALIESGEYGEAQNVRATIAEIDIKLEAAVARQAIEEARDFNAPQRLNAIWSAHKARNYEFVPVAPRVFDVYVDGQPQFSDVPIEQIVHETLVMADKGYASMEAELAQRQAEAYATSLGAAQGGLLAAAQVAPEQGNADAQNDLGVMYRDGTGVAQDYITAHMWFNIAGANGSLKATKNRDIMATLMPPADLSEAQRRAKVCMASSYKDCD